jgi:hypothetical protein
MIASANQVTATQQFVSYVIFNEMLMRSALYTSSWIFGLNNIYYQKHIWSNTT